MSKDSKKALVPKLRFPEFANFAEWQEMKLCDLANHITTKNKQLSEKRVLTNSAADGVVDQRDFFEKDIANHGNLAGYFVIDKEDFVYNPRISNLAPVGPISRNNIGKGVMSPLYTVFRFKAEFTDFYSHYFKSNHWHLYLRSVANTGARHDRMAITPDVLMNMPIYVPTVDEQRRVADCLSSLDDLIAAQSEKITALKTYKKGLLQQLFPQEGETVPRLRFPEFRKDGEWEIRTLGSCLKEKPAYGANASAVPFSPDLPRYIRITDIDDFGRLKNENPMSIRESDGVEYLLEEGDFLIARSGNTVGKTLLFKSNMGRCAHAGYLLKFRFNEKITSSSYFQFIAQTDRYWNWIKSNLRAGGQPNINAQEYSSYKFPLPPSIDEQRRIVSFLSTINEIVTYEMERAEYLKNHKQGLLQQLFPSLAEGADE